MIYLTAIPLALMMLGPVWWSAHLGSKFQMSEEVLDVDTGTESGQVRTSEGMIGPPRN